MYGGSSAEGSMISRQNSRTSADFDDFRGQIFTCVAVYKVCYYLSVTVIDFNLREAHCNNNIIIIIIIIIIIMIMIMIMTIIKLPLKT